LAVLLLILGLQPLWFSGSSNMGADYTTQLALTWILSTTSASVGLWIVIALLVPLAIGRGLTQPGMERRIASIKLPSLLAAALALNWIYDLGEYAGQRIGAAVTTILAPLRSERYVRWTLLLAVILVLLMVGR
jgi:hypothetical protein